MKKTKLFSLAVVVCLLATVLTGCGANSNTIKIGLLNELTGGNATFGTSAANGAKLAIKEANAKGGVLGKQIQGVDADNKSEPAEAANAMTKLLNQDKVVAVTGTFSSSNAIAAASVAASGKIPYLAVGAAQGVLPGVAKADRAVAFPGADLRFAQRPRRLAPAFEPGGAFPIPR